MKPEQQIFHALTGDNSDWIASLNKFQRDATAFQAKYKEKTWPGMGSGKWSKSSDVVHYYPHILPDSDKNRSLVLYSGIADEVIDYCDKNSIEMHSEFLNLKSSQVCCFIFLYPLKTNPKRAVKALSAVLPGVKSLEWIEFEYVGGEHDKELAEYLGESGGKRGANRTSIDAAICWKDSENRKILSLIEWKYTEAELGTCGGYSSSGNDDAGKAFCRTNPLLSDVTRCYLTQSRNNRRYWEHLTEAGLSTEKLKTIPGCPFRGPFYQLMRQFLVAGFLRKISDYDKVEVVLVEFRGNDALMKTGKELAPLGKDVVEAWNRVITDDVLGLRMVEAEELAEGIRKTAGLEEVGRYLGERFGV